MVIYHFYISSVEDLKLSGKKLVNMEDLVVEVVADDLVKVRVVVEDLGWRWKRTSREVVDDLVSEVVGLVRVV